MKSSSNCKHFDFSANIFEKDFSSNCRVSKICKVFKFDEIFKNLLVPFLGQFCLHHKISLEKENISNKDSIGNKVDSMEGWHKPKPSSPFYKPKTKTQPKSENFIQKLFIRETCGSFKKTPSKNEPKVRPFTRLPGRLAFCLRDVVPVSALEAGHIFLGFSKCGQFLLSYTQTHAETQEWMESLRILYHFR